MAAQRTTSKEWLSERRHNAWHFTRTLSLDTIASLAGILLFIGGPFWYWGRTMEERVNKLEAAATQTQRLDQERESYAREQRNALQTQVNQIDARTQSIQLELATLRAGINSRIQR